MDLSGKAEFPDIQIDITYECNLKCYNCNRMCRQAPSNDCMDMKQIDKFINETKDVKWGTIRILGGEPLLHKDILKIILSLQEAFPLSRLIVVTNGFGECKEKLGELPAGVLIENSNKVSPVQTFDYVNVAPKDLLEKSDFSEGCLIPVFCGIGLTLYGYYPCVIAGAIDRVFGFDFGRKSYTSDWYFDSEDKKDLLKKFCGLCGAFFGMWSIFLRSAFPTNEPPLWKPPEEWNIERFKKNDFEFVSPLWEEALLQYEKSPPVLSRY